MKFAVMVSVSLSKGVFVGAVVVRYSALLKGVHVNRKLRVSTAQLLCIHLR